MLTGENGILKMAGKAKEETEIAGELEKVQLAVTSAITQSYGSITEESINSTFQEEFGEQPVKSEIGYIYESDNSKYVIKENGEIAITRKGYETAKTLEYNKIGLPVTGIKCNYGTGENEVNITDWQILDVEAGNLYLISKNRVMNPDGNTHFGLDKVTNTATGKYTEVPAVKYFMNSNTIISKIAEKWLNKYVTNIKNNIYGYTNNNDANKRATLYALDSDIWKKSFIKTNKGLDYSNNVEYLIGSPTIEMFCDSYNKKNNPTGELIKVSLNSTGYSPINNLILTPFLTNLRYWIASPSNTYITDILYVDRNKIHYDAYHNATLGFRPVICLKSNVELKANYAEDETTIESYSIE